MSLNLTDRFHVRFGDSANMLSGAGDEHQGDTFAPNLMGATESGVANPFVNALRWGGWHWVAADGGPPTIDYYFDNDFYIWTDAAKASYRMALKEWSNVANFGIRETFNEGSADFIEHFLSNAQISSGSGITLGRHETPDTVTATNRADGWYNWQALSLPSQTSLAYDPTGLAKGGYGYTTFLHELGHALGLAHPHDTGGGSGRFPGVFGSGDYGSNFLNDGVYSVMSYNSGWRIQDPEGNDISAYGYNNTPAAFDIAAIQSLYGARKAFHSGNDTYSLKEFSGWTCIWDTGGTDKIVNNGSNDSVINLNSATLRNEEGGGGSPSYITNAGFMKTFGGFTIAADYTGALKNKGGEVGVLIENAVGGEGGDWITGNRLGNTLIGKGGSDTILGGDGNDKINGGDDFDVITGGKGNDTLTGGLGANVFVFKGTLGSSNVDTITDFYAPWDSLHLDRTFFKGIGGEGWLDANLFRAGGKALEADDRVIFKASTGDLFFDRDGSGGASKVLVARLGANESISADDILVIA